MNKVKVLLCLLMCFLCNGCYIQFGENNSMELFSTYRDTPAEAYMDIPFTDHVSQTYLDTIVKEIACITVSEEDVLWVALLNGNYVVEMPMLINSQNKYYAPGNCNVFMVTLEDNQDNVDEVNTPSKSFDFASGKSIYTYIYQKEEYMEIIEQLDEEYSEIFFDVELDDGICTLVYVYSVK